jgi:uncharacterized membrane-anchored protein YitT (DUF2179 family)
MIKKTSLKTELKNTLFIFFGSTLVAAGVVFFLLPAKIATGGTPGMAMLIYFISDISTGKAMLLINVPLLVIGMKFIDLHFALRSIFSILVTAILVDVLKTQVDFPLINSMLLSTLYGGTVVGAGVGLILKGNASAGGTTIIARIVSNYYQIKPAKMILLVDISIIITVGFIFIDIERSLWSMLSLYVTTQVIDKILTGAVSEKIVHIVSNKSHEIGNTIHQQLERGGTILSGVNITANEDKTILFVVVGARKIPLLRSIVLDIDPGAIMIVMEASELLGSNQLR